MNNSQGITLSGIIGFLFMIPLILPFFLISAPFLYIAGVFLIPFIFIYSITYTLGSLVVVIYKVARWMLTP